MAPAAVHWGGEGHRGLSTWGLALSGLPGLPLRLKMPKGPGPAAPVAPSSGRLGLSVQGRLLVEAESYRWVFVFCLFIYCLFLRLRSRGRSGGLECQDARLRNLVQVNNSGSHCPHLWGIVQTPGNRFPTSHFTSFGCRQGGAHTMSEPVEHVESIRTCRPSRAPEGSPSGFASRRWEGPPRGTGVVTGKRLDPLAICRPP